MSYRNATESLRAYRDRIAGELEEARRAARQLEPLENELAETERLLEKMVGKRALPLLESVRIAAPCTASWDEMVGDDRVRFCGKCEKNVDNVSAMPRDEAEALLRDREGPVCVRLYRRADGTVLTSDCPVGVKSRRRRRALAAAVFGSGVLAAAATTATATTAVTMGGIRPLPQPTTTATATATAIEGKVPEMGEPAPVAPADRVVMGHWGGPPAATAEQGTWLGGAVSVPQPAQTARPQPPRHR